MEHFSGTDVSVVIPAYNAAATIARAIDSAVNQTTPPLEVLVVDDGSEDNTADIVAAYGPPVRLIRQENGGPGAARNRAAREARGAWLGFLDADDFWYPTKLETQLACPITPEVGLVHMQPDHHDLDNPEPLDLPAMLICNWITASSVLLRRQAFEELGGFNEARVLIGIEDYNLWVRVAASRWKIIVSPGRLLRWTQGIGISSHLSRFLQGALYNFDDLGKRLDLDPALVRRKRNDVKYECANWAIHLRELGLARHLLWAVFRDERSVRAANALAVALMPGWALDARRAVMDRLRPAAPPRVLADRPPEMPGNR